MVTSEQIGEVAAALAAFQGSVPDILKGREVEVAMKTGGKYKFRYAELNDIYSAIRKPMADNGLSVTHLPGKDDTGNYLETRVIHSSGQWIGCRLPLKPEEQTLKGLGSALTYLRRYSLSAILGIAADEDDDGAAAERGEAVAKVKEKRQQAPRPASLRDQIISHINAETDPEKMGSYTARIAQRLEEKKLSEEDAKACRSAVAQKTADLVSKAASKGKLFDTAEKGAGVGV